MTPRALTLRGCTSPRESPRTMRSNHHGWTMSLASFSTPTRYPTALRLRLYSPRCPRRGAIPRGRASPPPSRSGAARRPWLCLKGNAPKRKNAPAVSSRLRSLGFGWRRREGVERDYSLPLAVSVNGHTYSARRVRPLGVRRCSTLRAIYRTPRTTRAKSITVSCAAAVIPWTCEPRRGRCPPLGSMVPPLSRSPPLGKH